MSINMQIFIGGALTGSHKTKNRNLIQADAIQKAIELRWNLDHPNRWKVKHLRWFLQDLAKTSAPETTYRYWLTVRILVEQLKKTSDWLPHLRGPWTRRPKSNGSTA